MGSWLAEIRHSLRGLLKNPGYTAAASFLFGVGATDPMTFLSVPLILGLVALLACVVPAWRAMGVEPVNALKYE